jgi:hypothetical protein
MEKTVETAASAHVAAEDVDANYEFYREHRGLQYTPEEEKRTLRKIDMQLIPILFMIYLINVSFSRVVVQVGIE